MPTHISLVHSSTSSASLLAPHRWGSWFTCFSKVFLEESSACLQMWENIQFQKSEVVLLSSHSKKKKKKTTTT